MLEIGVRHEFPTRARSLLCFALGQRSNFGCRFVSFVYGLFCYISRAVRLALFLEKKLRWYHCKPRINRVFQKRVISCSFFCHMGPPPLNFDYNQKIFRLTFQRANGLQRLRALWIRQAVLALGCAPTLSCLDPGGQVMLHHPRRVLCCRSKFLAPENLHYFSKFYGTRPTHASRFPKFFFVFDNCEITWKKCPSVRPTGKIHVFFFKVFQGPSRVMVRIVNGQVVNSAVQKRHRAGTYIRIGRIASKSQGPRCHVWEILRYLEIWKCVYWHWLYCI